MYLLGTNFKLGNVGYFQEVSSSQIIKLLSARLWAGRFVLVISRAHFRVAWERGIG